jgi:hypothetical protein
MDCNVVLAGSIRKTTLQEERNDAVVEEVNHKWESSIRIGSTGKMKMGSGKKS